MADPLHEAAANATSLDDWVERLRKVTEQRDEAKDALVKTSRIASECMAERDRLNEHLRRVIHKDDQ